MTWLVLSTQGSSCTPEYHLPYSSITLSNLLSKLYIIFAVTTWLLNLLHYSIRWSVPAYHFLESKSILNPLLQIFKCLFKIKNLLLLMPQVLHFFIYLKPQSVIPHPLPFSYGKFFISENVKNTIWWRKLSSKVFLITRLTVLNFVHITYRNMITTK